MLSKEPESDSDSDVVEIADDLATPNARSRRQAQQRQRSRSRSLTPPPMLPQQQVDKVRNFVRCVSPMYSIASSSDLYTSQALGESSTSTVPPPAEYGVRDQTPQTGRTSVRATPAPDEDEDMIQIDVTWKPHPLDKFGKELEFQYRIGRVRAFSVRGNAS